MNKYLNYLNENNFCIFLFHGVISKKEYEVRNYNGKHLLKSHFITFLKNLVKLGNPISMDEVVYSINNNNFLPPNSFAITFDDGFKNNYDIAAPILDYYNCPATFYVATSFIEKNHMSWIDQIELIIEKTINQDLNLPWGNYHITNDHNSKIKLLEDIRFNVKNYDKISPFDIVQIVYNQLNKDIIYSGDDELTKMMSWRQVREISNHNLFTIGGHSHSHQILSFLNNNEMEKDIDKSFELISKNLKLKPHHYSYPEGLIHCFNEDIINHLKSHGVVCAPSAINGINNHMSDLFYLKRVNVNILED